MKKAIRLYLVIFCAAFLSGFTATNCMRKRGKKIRRFIVIFGPSKSGKIEFSERIVEKLQNKNIFCPRICYHHGDDLVNPLEGTPNMILDLFMKKVAKSGKRGFSFKKIFGKSSNKGVSVDAKIINKFERMFQKTTCRNAFVNYFTHVIDKQKENIILIGVTDYVQDLPQPIKDKFKLFDIKKLQIKSDVFLKNSIYDSDTFKRLYNWANKKNNARFKKGVVSIVKDGEIDLEDIFSRIKYLCIEEFLPLDGLFRGVANACIILQLLKKRCPISELCALTISFVKFEDLACKKIHPE